MSARTARKKKPGAGGADVDDDGIYAAYLYYFPSAGPVRIYESWDPANVLDPEVEITRLATNAVDNGKNPPFYTNDTSVMMMRRRSYLAFAVNASDYTFGTSEAITFKGFDHFHSEIAGNHTFFGTKSLSISTSGTSSRPLLVVYCENHMISSHSKDKLAYKEGEKFTFGLPFFPIKKRLLAPDTGGTNLGPPVPPPARKRG